MNHEFWNEIGNLYFMNGAYEPAIHAYLRSIKLENTFGRSYSNLAMAISAQLTQQLSISIHPILRIKKSICLALIKMQGSSLDRRLSNC